MDEDVMDEMDDLYIDDMNMYHHYHQHQKQHQHQHHHHHHHHHHHRHRHHRSDRCTGAPRLFYCDHFPNKTSSARNTPQDGADHHQRKKDQFSIRQKGNGASRNFKQPGYRSSWMSENPYSQQVSISKCIHIDPTQELDLTGEKRRYRKCDPGRTYSERCIRLKNGAMYRNECSQRHIGYHQQAPRFTFKPQGPSPENKFGELDSGTGILSGPNKWKTGWWGFEALGVSEPPDRGSVLSSAYRREGFFSVLGLWYRRIWSNHGAVLSSAYRREGLFSVLGRWYRRLMVIIRKKNV